MNAPAPMPQRPSATEVALSMRATHKSFRDQFALPEGPEGGLAGVLLDWKNRQRGRWMTSLLRVPEGGRVAEVGFGPGRDLVRLGRVNPALSLLGVDPSDVMVRMAQRNLKRAGLRAELAQGTATELPWSNGGLDVLYSSNSVQFWGDVHRGLIEAHRVLRPGGQLLVSISPRNRGATQDSVTDWGAQLLKGLGSCGFARLALHRKPARPLDVVAVVGIRA